MVISQPKVEFVLSSWWLIALARHASYKCTFFSAPSLVGKKETITFIDEAGDPCKCVPNVTQEGVQCDGPSV